MEDLRREGADVSVPSNSVSYELAEKVRNKYFPKTEVAPKRGIKVIKKPAKPEEAPAEPRQTAEESTVEARSRSKLRSRSKRLSRAVPSRRRDRAGQAPTGQESFTKKSEAGRSRRSRKKRARRSASSERKSKPVDQPPKKSPLSKSRNRWQTEAEAGQRTPSGRAGGTQVKTAYAHARCAARKASSPASVSSAKLRHKPASLIRQTAAAR